MDKIEREEQRKKLIEDRKKHEIEELNKVYPPQMESIGERIKIVRKDNKKNQKDFAEELGISQSHISNIEKGADKPCGCGNESSYIRPVVNRNIVNLPL